MECLYVMDNKHFDFAQWREDTEKWFKNKEALKFQNHFGFKDGKCIIEFQNVDEKLIKELTRVTQKVIGGALYWIALTYSQYTVLPEDKESENIRKSLELKVKIKFFIDIYLSSGIEKFLNVLDYYSGSFKLQYELSKMTFVNGTYYDLEGFELKNGHWEKDGIMKPVTDEFKNFIDTYEETA